jgi:C1A family cysteine protease
MKNKLPAGLLLFPLMLMLSVPVPGAQTYYDARLLGKAPVVRSQGRLGTCWALTAVSALEAALLPQKHEIFSADHMSLQNGFVISQEEGGDYKMIMAYLSGGMGPVYEEDDPYGDGETADGLQPVLSVREIRVLEGKSRDEIKQMILSFGPVQTSLYMQRSTTAPSLPYYNSETCAFYYPEQMKPTHDILVLGWDDAYPADSFITDPGMDGAWICQNTWGEDFGKKGIFYVSYADANILGSGLAYCRMQEPGEKEHIYQNDVCGWQGIQGYDTDHCYFANVWTAERSEKITSVGMYSTGEKTEYEIWFVPWFQDTASFRTREYITEGQFDDAGYFTVDLDEPVSLTEGQTFAVVVHIRTEGTLKPVAVEMKKGSFTENVVTEGKNGYVSLTAELWEHTEERYGTNVCLKVYTLPE